MKSVCFNVEPRKRKLFELKLIVKLFYYEFNSILPLNEYKY